MLKAYIASKNKTKVQALADVLSIYNIESIEVNSEIIQPFGEEQTIQAAIRRATKLPKDGLRFAFEGGVSIIRNEYLKTDDLYIINYGVMIDQDDKIYIAGGESIPLPEQIKNALIDNGKIKEGVELTSVMSEYAHTNNVGSTSGAIGIFTGGKVDRYTINKRIVELLYSQYTYYKSRKE